MQNQRTSLKQKVLIGVTIVVSLAVGIGWSVYDGQNSQADCFRRDQKFDQAIAAYKEALKQPIHKDDALCMKNLAYCLRRTGNLDEALNYINRAIGLSDKNSGFFGAFCCGEASLAHQVYAERGWIYYKKGDYDRATEDFEKALAKEKHATAYTGLAAVCEARKDYEGAEKNYTNAISVASSSYNKELAYHERAIYWRDRGNTENEKADLLTAVSQASCPQAYFELGSLHQKRGEWKDAEQNFSRAIAKSSNRENFYHSRAQVNAEMGNYRQAVDDINEALRLDPTCAVAASDKSIFEKQLAEQKSQSR
jgi:tetratricopeptide (TPR) repeat protein